MKRDFREPAIHLLLAAVMVMLIFYPASAGKALIYSGDFTGSDALDLNIPLKFNLGAALRSGELPLWTPLLLNGYPLLGEGQTGIFYPPNLLFSLLPMLWCANGLIFFHLLLAASGLYAYGRLKGLSWEAATFSSLVFSFSGFYVLHLRHLNMLEAASWFPWLFYFAGLHLSSRKPAALLSWSAVLALQWLCGHPAITYLGLFGVALLYGATFIKDIRKGKSFLLPLSFIGAASLSGLLAAVQLLPTLELVPLSLRSSLTRSDVAHFPFALESLWHFINPYFMGNPARGAYPLSAIVSKGVFWENCAYIGILPLLMAFGALRWWKEDGRVRGFSLFVISGIVLALGPATPLYGLLLKVIPGFHLFRFPARFLVYALFGLVLLAGVFWDRIAPAVKGSRARLAMFCLVFLVSSANLAWFCRSFNAFLEPSWCGPPPTLRSVLQGHDGSRIYSFAALLSWQRAYIKDRGWMGPRENLDRYRSLLAPDYNLLFGVPQVGEKTWCEGGMAPSRMAELAGIVEREAMPLYGGKVILVPDGMIRLLRLQHTGFICSVDMLAHPALERIAGSDDGKEVNVYRIKGSLPRASMVYRHRVFYDSDELRGALLDPSFAPEQEVLLEEEPAIVPRGTGVGKVELLRESLNGLEYSVSTDHDGFLFLADTWFPGWKASVDGVPAKIFRADYAFRAVAVRAGTHRVAFSYRPASLEQGALLSLAGLLLLSILGWKTRQSPREKPGTAPSF
ncbi:MAG: YfhO family protein [Candidatus Eremiobacteraeota bacterium]|nr:YfhO family protein [Candidatus Eremiobacteraeota bacterium]